MRQKKIVAARQMPRGEKPDVHPEPVDEPGKKKAMTGVSSPNRERR